MSPVVGLIVAIAITLSFAAAGLRPPLFSV
ncbi:hypothetical protein FEK30_03515 [Picosynechococcus sp. PCC 11901]|nr:hypothetical protein FEK30_03515 [Picosynechococcus sp. PCC 11901]